MTRALPKQRSAFQKSGPAPKQHCESVMSELKIEDLQLGSGKAVVKGALITTQYRGWLEDGTEFDSSYSRGKPFQCVIGTRRVIQGWDQGLMGMQVGGTRKLWVPAHLGYGERQVGAIPPNSNLVFEIELLEVLTRDD
ncbi:Peptidylprolyl isomerase, FKBP-type [Pseudomonas sp. SO81]|nr:Peptidylprolyl isomerase, FKBP-type [Pseudomonas sp. SO81]